ncbi:MAG: hypothetical protein IJF74_06350 [Clostridia bacterium]|nr:hypothetical protein [Clostridia bacterium]
MKSKLFSCIAIISALLLTFPSCGNTTPATGEITTEVTTDAATEPPIDKSIPFSLSVEQKSTIFGPKNESSSVSPSYGTIVLLEHGEEADGVLLATMNAGDSFVGRKDGYCYKILRSEDNGATWEYCGYAKDDLNTAIGATFCISTPHLFELPEDMGELKAGTVLLAGVSKDAVKTSELNVTAITLFCSTNGGKKWQSFATLDVAGGEKEGVWEPFLCYDDGKLFCFYSDDSDPEHDQKIVYKWTSDLKNWNGIDGVQDCTAAPTKSTKYAEPFEAVACRSQKLRPGMPSVAKMKNGEFILCYEMVGVKGSPVYCKTTSSLLDWGDVSEDGDVVVQFGNTPGAAPWIAYSPLGGECGVLFLGAHHNANGNAKYTPGSTDLFLSFDYGKTWTRTENPLPHTIVEGTTASDRAYYRGYSPSMVVSSDGKTLYYANMVEYPKNENRTQLDFARIKIEGYYQEGEQ